MSFFSAHNFLSIVYDLQYICSNFAAASNPYMKGISRLVVSLLLVFAFLSNALPCGPGYTTPLFDTASAPEDPYTDYAAGRLGIVKPTFRRSVLYAAYRYIAGNGMSTAEQKAVVEVWNAEINRKDFRDDSVDGAVKAWIEKRKDIVGKDEKTPDIYTDRDYGGYDFFPNCTKNAFETATETLADRVSAHGPSDPNMVNWVKAQDQVFENCAKDKQTPDAAPPGAPDWLQKDRAYQRAAAEFYSLDYESAKKEFAKIAQDGDSPWAETASYLVARTLIRQASLSKDKGKAADYYSEAEQSLEKITSGKFADSAEKMLSLIAYRLHPRTRVGELARKLTITSSGDNFRQDVIDYTWLLDKLEDEVLTAEEKRKQEEEKKKEGNRITGAEYANRLASSNTLSNANMGEKLESEYKSYSSPKVNDDDIEIRLYTDKETWGFYVPANATDDEVIAKAESLAGHPLSDERKGDLRYRRRIAYSGQFSSRNTTDHEAYYGEEKMSPALMPEYLRKDELTEWLFTYRMKGPEAYLYSLKRFRESGSDLWLMTALSKADKGSTQLPRLIEAANNASRTSPAYTTIAYHQARILLFQSKTADARKLVDSMLSSGDDLTVSARNSFMDLRFTLAETLEDFLKFSLKRPYGFDFDGETGSIDDIIARRKAEYDPEYDKDGQAAFEREVDEEYRIHKLWQQREMFDSDTIDAFNQHFPTTALIEVERSPALPDYLRERFAIAIWTRSYLMDNMAMLLTITPEVAKYHPEFGPQLSKITGAKTQAAIDHATLYCLLKNPLFSPYVEEGIGKTDNEFGEFDSNDWWCEVDDMTYNEETGSEEVKVLPARPPFLTAAQSQSAQTERKRLKEIGDAPKFLANKVLDWAKHYPTDRRVPEALYIVILANGWTKYGCGSNEGLKDELATYLRKHYPTSEWAAKLAADESDK